MSITPDLLKTILQSGRTLECTFLQPFTVRQLGLPTPTHIDQRNVDSVSCYITDETLHIKMGFNSIPYTASQIVPVNDYLDPLLTILMTASQIKVVLSGPKYFTTPVAYQLPIRLRDETNVYQDKIALVVQLIEIERKLLTQTH